MTVETFGMETFAKVILTIVLDFLQLVTHLLLALMLRLPTLQLMVLDTPVVIVQKDILEMVTAFVLRIVSV